MSSPARMVAFAMPRPAALATALAWVAAAGALLVVPAPAPAAPSTSLVSVGSTNVKGSSDSSAPSVSANGRWVAFYSSATNLVPGTTGNHNIYLRDRDRGETIQVAVGAGGQPDGSVNDGATVDANAEHVAFYSNSTNLAPSPGGLQAYLWTRADRSIRRLSTNVAPAGPYVGTNDVDISDDGTKVVYTAYTSADPSRYDVFLADVATGTIRKLGEPSPGVAANSSVVSAAFSGDGRYVAYSSAASDLVTGDSNSTYDIFREDLTTRAKVRVSITADNGQPNGASQSAAVNDDGCVVAFNSSATNITAGATTAGTRQYVRDVCQGTTEVVTVANGGSVGTSSGAPTISGDGCLVGFYVSSGSGVLSPAPAGRAIATRDRCQSVTSRIDVSTAGEPGNAPVTPGKMELGGRKGRYFVFSSTATNLAQGDPDNLFDVYLRDSGVNDPPVAAFTTTQSANRVTVDASASRDPDGYRLTGAVNFGDGTADQAGLSVEHAYPRAGTYTVALTVTDADGATGRTYQAVTVGDPPPTPPAPTPPGGGGTNKPGGTDGGTFGGSGTLKLSAVKLSRSSFAVVPAGAKAKGNQGATLSATLSAPADLTLTFERRVSGRKRNGKCVAGGRRGTPCKTYKKSGSVTKATISLTGRVGGAALRTGTYRLAVAATDDAGTTAKTTLTVTIVRSHR